VSALLPTRWMVVLEPPPGHPRGFFPSRVMANLISVNPCPASLYWSGQIPDCGRCGYAADKPGRCSAYYRRRV
jgi:hypothetical protein